MSSLIFSFPLSHLWLWYDLYLSLLPWNTWLLTTLLNVISFSGLSRWNWSIRARVKVNPFVGRFSSSFSSFIYACTHAAFPSPQNLRIMIYILCQVSRKDETHCTIYSTNPSCTSIVTLSALHLYTSTCICITPLTSIIYFPWQIVQKNPDNLSKLSP